MIQLRRLNGEWLWVNPDLIKYVEAKPDTMLTFTDGKTLLVSTSATEVCELIKRYKQNLSVQHHRDRHHEV